MGCEEGGEYSTRRVREWVVSHVMMTPMSITNMGQPSVMSIRGQASMGDAGGV